MYVNPDLYIKISGSKEDRFHSIEINKQNKIRYLAQVFNRLLVMNGPFSLNTILLKLMLLVVSIEIVSLINSLFPIEARDLKLVLIQ